MLGIVWRSVRNSIRYIAGFTLLAVAFCLVCDMFGNKGIAGDLSDWIRKNGDAELLRYYDEATTPEQKDARGVSLKYFYKTYGAGVWTEHFKNERGKSYGDFVEVALRIADSGERDAFLEAYGDNYAALADSEGETAAALCRRYVETLGRLQAQGGETWHLVKGNPLALGVYEIIGQEAGKWRWYMDNADWCNAFLETCSLAEGEMSVAHTLDSFRAYAPAYRAFYAEIGKLTPAELEEMNRQEESAHVHTSLYASFVFFVQTYGEALLPLAEAGIPMIESMTVIANSFDAETMKTPESLRKLGEDLACIYRRHPVVWKAAADENGVGAVAFHRLVPKWSEQVLGQFADKGVVPFLREYYDEKGARANFQCNGA